MGRQMSRGLILASLMAVVGASAYGLTLADAEAPGATAPPVNTGRAAGEGFLEDFTQGLDRVAHVRANWDVASDWMAASYRLANVEYGANGVTLSARREQTKVSDYTSSELQRPGFYGYGRYEVVMKASDAPGVVSSFFTYAGEDTGDPHDEIDFELLGRSPRQAHLNFFSNGANYPIDVDLWFDASAAEHLYAYEWSPTAIIWYVDGAEVRRVVATPALRLPTTTARVMASVWTGNRKVAEWVGWPSIDSASASYRCMSHVPINKTGSQCSDTFNSPAKP
jgi:endo-1,3-1,4-beta-glycanase ExoK